MGDTTKTIVVSNELHAELKLAAVIDNQKLQPFTEEILRAGLKAAGKEAK